MVEGVKENLKTDEELSENVDNNEELNKQLLKIKEDLDEVKSKVFSNEELKEKMKDLKRRLKTVEEEFKEKKDTMKDTLKEEFQAKLDSIKEQINLELSVREHATEDNTQVEDEKKWFFKSIWDRFSDKRTSFKNKDNKEKTRTVWLVAAWAWGMALFHSLFSEEWREKRRERREKRREARRAAREEKRKEREQKRKEKKDAKKAAREAAREKKRKERSELPFRNRWYWRAIQLSWLWTIGYYIIHWAKTWKWNPKDFLDWNEKSELTIDESIHVAAWEVHSWKLDKSMYKQNFDKIEYNENSWSILSYWESTQINEKAKCIVWLEKVKFENNTELVHAANIVNCLKYNLRWKWWAADAFSQTDTWGDIQFYFSKEWANEVLSWSNTDFWRNLLWGIWWVWWTMLWAYTENVTVWIWSVLWLWAWWLALWNAIDNNSALWKCCSTIKDWNNFNLFISYLNSIEEWWESIWLPWNLELPPDDKSPIQKYIRLVEEDIRGTKITDKKKAKERNLNAEIDPDDPTRYKISSYGQEAYIKLNGTIQNDLEWKINPSTIQSITIEQYSENDIWWELKLNFPNTEEWLKECIRVINLTNMIRKEYWWNWWEDYPVFYNKSWHLWLYKDGLNIDTNWGNNSRKIWWMRILSNDVLSSKYPTLLADLQKSESNDQSYFEDQLNNKRNGSSYLKFVNWMRTNSDGNFWTNWQK